MATLRYSIRCTCAVLSRRIRQMGVDHTVLTTKYIRVHVQSWISSPVKGRVLWGSHYSIQITFFGRVGRHFWCIFMPRRTENPAGLRPPGTGREGTPGLNRTHQNSASSKLSLSLANLPSRSRKRSLPLSKTGTNLRGHRAAERTHSPVTHTHTHLQICVFTSLQ